MCLLWGVANHNGTVKSQRDCRIRNEAPHRIARVCVQRLTAYHGVGPKRRKDRGAQVRQWIGLSTAEMGTTFRRNHSMSARC